MKNEIASQTKNQQSRVARFKELDARIKQKLGEIEKAFANISKMDFPADWVDLSGFDEFIKSRGIILTSGDEDGLAVLRLYFCATPVLPPETIVHVLTTFNQARAKAVSA